MVGQTRDLLCVSDRSYNLLVKIHIAEAWVWEEYYTIYFLIQLCYLSPKFWKLNSCLYATLSLHQKNIADSGLSKTGQHKRTPTF